MRYWLDNDATYVLVCFGQDLTDEQRRKARELLESYLKQCGYGNPRVEVWSQNNIIGFLEVFPSLSLRVTGRDGARFQTHRSWSRDAEMKSDFRAGKSQEDFISSMRENLRKSTDAVHVRVLGEAGIGKTRLAMEATRAEDLEPLVIYSTAVQFRYSYLINEILREDNQFSAILVIDDCGQDSSAYIWNKLKYCGPRVKIISIYNDYDISSGNISYLDAPALDKEHVSEIIQGYGIPGDQVGQFLQWFPKNGTCFRIESEK